MKTFRMLSTLFAAALTLSAAAQDKVETTVSADIVSRYIWRGYDCGHASFQPTLGIGYKGLSLKAWGSTGITDSKDTRELDLTLAYEVGGFNIGITDYWFDTGGEKYFSYAAHSTLHTFEANIGYDFGFMSLQWYTNFAGHDGYTKEGGDKRAYSSYAELGVPFKFAGCSWDAALGVVPYGTTYYSKADGFAVTNVSLKASKEFAVTDKFSPAVFASVIANPCLQTAYLVCGITLQP